MLTPVFFLPNFNIGGAELATIKIVNELYLLGLKPKIIVISNTGAGVSRINKNIEIINLNKKKLAFSCWSFFKAVRSIENPVVFSVMTQVSFVALFVKNLFLLRLKIIPIEHSCFANWKGEFPIFKYYLYIALYNFLYLFSHRIICVATGINNELRKIFIYNISKKCAIIYNPIIDQRMIEAFETSTYEKNIFNKSITFIGRLAPEKNLPLLINSFWRLNSKHPDVLLYIIGDGHELNYLRSLVTNLGIEEKVIFTGHKENPFENIKNTSVVALTSHVEGFPTVLIESLFFGVPVVSVNCISGPNEIIINEKLGILVDSYDEGEFCIALEKAIFSVDYDPEYMHLFASSFNATATCEKLIKIMEF